MRRYPMGEETLLTDKVLQSFKEAFLVLRRRPRLGPERVGDLLHRFALRGVHLLRHAHGEEDVLVAFAAAVQARNALPLEREDAPRGHSRRHVEAGVSV